MSNSSKDTMGGVRKINIYDFYITPEEYEFASEKGIRAALLEVRIRSLGWEKQKAINTPPHKKKRLGEEWIELAEQNGICYRTFLWRVNTLGWDKERAATQVLQDRKDQAKRACEKSRKYPKEIIALIKENDINYDTFRYRVRNGWDLYKAATTPTMTPSEVGLLTKDKRKKSLDNIFKLKIVKKLV